MTVHTWAVSISGHSQKAPVGGSVKYSPSAPVESITPEATVTAKGGGKHYTAPHQGPHNEVTGVTEASLQRPLARSVDPPIVPLALTLGLEGDPRGEHATFTPGNYEIEVRVGSPKHVSFYGEGRGSRHW